MRESRGRVGEEYRLRSTDYRGRIKPFSVISTLYSVLDLVLPNLLHAGTVHWLASGSFKGVRGFGRGEAGAKGRLSLATGASLAIKGLQIIPAGDRLIVEMPGGGGYGDPFTRDPALVARDVHHGLIEPDAAEADYGVILNDKGELNTEATARRRASRRG